MDSSHEQETSSFRSKIQGPLQVRSLWLSAAAIVLVALVTLLGNFYGQFLGLTNIGMLYLLPVVFASAFLGLASSIVIAVVSVVLFDVLFVPPVFRLAVDDARYLISFAVFVVVAWTSGSMADRLRLRMREAINRETRTKALYDLAKGLSALADIDSLAGKVVGYLADTVNAEVTMYLPDKNHQLQIIAASSYSSTLVTDHHEAEAADWSFSHSRRCGSGIDTRFETAGLYLPITTEDKTLGVLGIKAAHELTAEQLDIIEASAGLAALGVLRLHLADEAQNIKTLEERERLSTALFNSVSHDMKTPLASILGAISGLVDDEDLYNDEQKSSLLTSIKRGALRMNRVVNNLLDMARLESGYLHLNRDWCDIQDIIGVTLRENGEIMQDHPIRVEIPETTSLIMVDYALIEQVLTNLLYNAAKYSPSGSEILVQVEEDADDLVVSVVDQGNGIAPGDEEKIFEKFYRLESPGNVSGTGLGLSICRGIIEAHEGRIWAQNQPGHGTILSFALPVDHRDPYPEQTK
ncbi:MAG: ATP-binding protein [Deltaproteobacteria bacterium]